MADRRYRLSTRLVHAGEPSPRIGGALSAPVFQTSTYETGDEASCQDVRYHRLNNSPNHRILTEKLAAVEETEDALVTASGMAAISAALLSCLGAGDHLLVQRGVYGGTHTLLTDDLAALGIRHTFVDGRDPGQWERALQDRTRAFYAEAITNPLLEVGELAAVADFARAHGLTAIMDATFATPVNFRPARWGYDLVVHSATKYLNGHSDLVAGVVAGRAGAMERVRHRMNHLGGCLSPHGCFLLYRGLKTLDLRVRAQNRGAMAVAAALEAHPAVSMVRYPGLAGDPSHERARAFFTRDNPGGGYGGMVSFELAGGAAAADALVAALRLPIYAPSLGGVETLITLPARTTHLGMRPEERAAAGISDGLVRISVGIEDPEDLVRDLRQALDRL